MRENTEYLKTDILKYVRNGLVMLNAIIAWALFHYTAWCIYSVYRFLSG